MAATIEITTRLSKGEIKGLLTDLPGILSGKKADRYGIRPVFFGAFAHEFYRQASDDYKTKADGGSDTLGNAWMPLAPSTLKRRKYLGRKYPLALENLILRVSDKLLTTLTPGTFDGMKYHPRRNQQYHVARGVITLGSKLSYASYAHAKRPFWPDDVSPYVESATNKAIEATLNYVKLITQ